MFAARADQENAVYGRQTAGAAKALNQGAKGLAPKTPGHKTPLKAQNDENATNLLGKTGGKGKQAVSFDGNKSSKLDASAFVTPAGPRARAPLGNKTTNAKAGGFKTPAPKTQEKPSASSPRMRRAKIKVHEAEPETTQQGPEEPDIEFMPPRETPLPDHPDDCWPIDRKYPQFEGKNLTRGWSSEFSKQRGDSDDEEFSDLEEKLKAFERSRSKPSKFEAKKKGAAIIKAESRGTNADPLVARKQPSSLSSKRAASALATIDQRSAGGRPHFAAPTATTKARLPSVLTSRKSNSVAQMQGNARFPAAKAASNSTLGYSKGRAISGVARKPSLSKHAGHEDEQKGAPSDSVGRAGSSLEELFGAQNLYVGEEADAELRGSGIPGYGVESGSEDEALKDFQLPAL